MPPGDESALLAVALPARRAAAAILDAWDSGHAVLPLDPAAPPSELRRVLQAARPTHLLDDGGRHPMADGIPVDGLVAAVVTTSGTEGPFKKCVELTHEGLRASVDGVHAALNCGAGDRWLCCVPLHHVAGLAVLARGWVSGVAPVVHEGFDPHSVAAASTADRPPTLVSLVPTMVLRAFESGVDLSAFRTVLVGGAAVGEPLLHRARSAGASVVVSYGLTETWGGVVHDGRPIPGAEVGVGEDGEILIRGAMVMKGYRGDAPASHRAFTGDGWLRTGDIGMFDPDGRLRVVDRIRDLVITGGVSVSPAEIEAVLSGHPCVADVGVAGVADPEWGERVVAYVVPEDRRPAPDVEELRRFARPQLGRAALPRQVEVVRSIPRSPGGKPLRRLLRGQTDE